MRLIRLVGNDKEVLKIGCSEGYMLNVLKNNNCMVVGIEIDRKAGGKAKSFYRD